VPEGDSLHRAARALQPLVGQRAEGVHCLVDVLIGGLGRLDGDLDGRVLGKLDLRADVELGGEDELAVLGRGVGHLGDLDLGAAQRPDPGLLDGVLVEPVEPVIDGGLDDVAAAHALVDELLGNLALAESRNLHLTGDRLVSRVDVRPEFLERDLNIELHPRGGKVFDSALHSVGLLSDWDSFRIEKRGPGIRKY